MIVARGLGRAYRTPLVTGGFGRAGSVVVPVGPPGHGAVLGSPRRRQEAKRRDRDDDALLFLLR